MPITINYNPEAEALARVAQLAGQGQFAQRRDAFALDTAQFGERQRQFDVGTRLNVAQLGQRERERISRERSQIFDQIGRERMALFDAAQRQAFGQQAFEQQAILQAAEAQQRSRERDLGRLAEFQQADRTFAFRERQAKAQRIEDAFANRQITPEQRAEAYSTLEDQYGRYGLPPIGAVEQVAPPPDPMEQAQQQAEALNQGVFGGNPVAFVQPDGKIDFLPYQNTPAGIQQDHESKMEMERLKQQAAEREARAKEQAAQQEAAQKRREDIQKQIDKLEEDRRKAVFNAASNLDAQPGSRAQIEQSWDAIYGPRLRDLQQELRSVGQPPPSPRPLMDESAPGDAETINPGATYPNLPPVISQWDQQSADELARTFQQSDVVGRMIGERPQLPEGRLAQDRMVDQWMMNLYRWTLEEGLPFIQDPQAVSTLPAHSWFIGEDFLKHRVPGRAATAVLGGAVTDFVGALTRANLEGLSDAALGLYDAAGD